MARIRNVTHGRRPGSRPGDRVAVHGLECEVVDDATAEQADFVVCAWATPTLYERDNLTGPCADCGQLLQWRPYAPKRPPKLCSGCALDRVHDAV